MMLIGFTSCKEAPKTDDVVTKNIEVSKAFYEMFNKSDWAGIEKIIDPKFEDHSVMFPNGMVQSRDSMMKNIKMFKEGFPDGKFEILSVAGAGDKVFIEFHYTGTNTGSMMGMPASNKKIDYKGVDLLQMKDGLATHHWDYGDNVTMMVQMGYMPDPTTQMAPPPAAKDSAAAKK